MCLPATYAGSLSGNPPSGAQTGRVKVPLARHKCRSISHEGSGFPMVTKPALAVTALATLVSQRD
jgi:hypothetical protein